MSTTPATVSTQDRARVLCLSPGAADEIASHLADESTRLDPVPVTSVADAAVTHGAGDADALVVADGEPDAEAAALATELAGTDDGPPVVVFGDLDPAEVRAAYDAGVADVVAPSSSGAYAVLANRLAALVDPSDEGIDGPGDDAALDRSVPTTGRTEMAGAGSAASVARAAAAAVRERTGRDAGVALYDGPAGRFRAVDTPDGGLDTAALIDRVADAAWAAFANASHTSASDDAVDLFPLGRHGVLLVADGDDDGGATPVAPATVAGRARAHLDRLDTRPERGAIGGGGGSERTSEADQLRETLDLVGRIQRKLLEATTRGEVERIVCTELAATDWFRTACVGVRGAQGGIEVREAASTAEGFCEGALALGGDGERTGPAETALDRRESAFVGDLDAEPPIEPWREAALRCGSRSVAAVPLAHQGSLYGALCVFAARPDAFERRHRELLETCSRLAAFATNAAGKRLALAAEDAVELEFRIDDASLSFMQFVEERGCEFEFEELAPRADELFEVFFTIRGATEAEATAFGERSPVVADLELVTARDDELLFRGQIRNTTILTTLFEHGAVPRTITATDSEGQMTVELPRTADVRTFVEMLQSRYPGTELVARRERDRAGQPRGAFRAGLESRLTERQFEILRTAYADGFFEWPRDSTGEDVAASLDISQPTFSRHLREGQRRLFEFLLDE